MHEPLCALVRGHPLCSTWQGPLRALPESSRLIRAPLTLPFHLLLMLVVLPRCDSPAYASEH